LGWFTLGLFWIHVDFNWPSGWLEQILATVFLMITASGVYGLYVTRTYPKKLTAVGREVIFEQIPVQRRQLIRQAESLALEVGYQSDIIAEFIARRLLPFLIRERSWSYLAFPNGKARRGLLSEVESLKRYLAADQHAETLRLRHLIQAKDDLDYHHALQGRLKGWLFLHVCLTGVLIGLALVHTLVVHVFQGGL
jgi:hypothetical protein